MTEPTLPITPVEAWRDSNGTMHATKEAALTAEIERVLGRVGNGGSASVAPGMARTIIDQRAALMPLLEAFGPVLVEAERSAA